MRRAAVAACVAAWAGAAAAVADGPPQPPRVVRFVPERDYGPFIYAEADGRIAGLSVDLLERARRHAGLAVTMLPARPLAAALAAMRSRDADLVAAVRPTPERAAYLLFTAPYVSVPAVVVVRDDEGSTGSLAALAGREVAVGAGYAVEAHVRRRYPRVRWQAVADDATALRGLVDGRFAAVVTDAASLAFIARRDGLQGLRPAEQVGFEYSLAFGVRSDWPQLRATLDDALRAIPAAERRALVERWVPPAFRQDTAPAHAPQATAAALALLIVAGVVAMAGLRRRRDGRPR
jgi:ABC-type amino acid transport substrate-binding protein